MEQLTRGIAFTKAINSSKRSVEAVVSTETVDRAGDIVDQASWRLAQFLRNPVVLYMHDHGQPVGRAEDVAVRNGQLEATIVFADTERGREIFQLYAEKALRAFSVGFSVGRIEEEIGEGRTVTRLLDCELWEISAVTVPANPDALAKHKALGLVPESAGAEIVRAALDARESVGGDDIASVALRQPRAPQPLDDEIERELRRAGL